MGGCNPFPGTCSGLGPPSLSPNAISGSLFAVLTGSRGSSWHKWPILRLTHRVQGRSYNQWGPPYQQSHAKQGALSGTNARTSLTRSQVICYHWSSITVDQSTHIRQTQIGTCCVALGSGSPSAGSRYKLFMVGVSAHDSKAKEHHPSSRSRSRSLPVEELFLP